MPMMTVREAAASLAHGWARYVDTFGIPPHGTVPQLSALIELSPLLKAVLESPVADTTEEAKRLIASYASHLNSKRALPHRGPGRPKKQQKVGN